MAFVCIGIGLCSKHMFKIYIFLCDGEMVGLRRKNFPSLIGCFNWLIFQFPLRSIAILNNMGPWGKWWKWDCYCLFSENDNFIASKYSNNLINWTVRISPIYLSQLVFNFQFSSNSNNNKIIWKWILCRIILRVTISSSANKCCDRNLKGSDNAGIVHYTSLFQA